MTSNVAHTSWCTHIQANKYRIIAIKRDIFALWYSIVNKMWKKTLQIKNKNLNIGKKWDFYDFMVTKIIVTIYMYIKLLN